MDRDLGITMPQDHCFHLETVYSDEKGFSGMGRLERERGRGRDRDREQKCIKKSILTDNNSGIVQYNTIGTLFNNTITMVLCNIAY